MGGLSVTASSELIAACRHLSSRGLSPGGSGNVSVRAGDDILITPTGSSLSRVVEADLVRIDLAGTVLFGGKPSKEWPLHLAMYRQRPDSGAVVHLHSPYSTALACLTPDENGRALLAPLTPYAVLRLGDLPVAPYAKPGTVELARGVESLANASAAILLANHGSVVAAESLRGAVDLTEELEAAAVVEFLTAGRARMTLTEQQLGLLRHD
jgi:ribulose-5-phosphate 4-epimerase/fuculose-1-phosphate aldolase